MKNLNATLSVCLCFALSSAMLCAETSNKSVDAKLPRESKVAVESNQIIASKIPALSNTTSKPAFIAIADIYKGANMKGVKRGDIKNLRIMEIVPAKSSARGVWENAVPQSPAMNYDDAERKIYLGVVSVENDGSAFFQVPSNKSLYLQALDKDGYMVQSSKGFVSFLPEEIAVYEGFLESRSKKSPDEMKNAASALARKPSQIETNGFSEKPFSYVENIQPIWTGNCVDCHDYEGVGAAAVILAADRGLVFNKSYVSLHGTKGLASVGADEDKNKSANTWGAKQSKLLSLILDGHGSAIDNMGDDEIEALKLWLDMNSPYYACDASAFSDNPSGRSPLTSGELSELSELSKVKILSQKDTLTITPKFYQDEFISFDRPEKSEILRLIDDNTKRARARDIINLGSQRLKEKKRADMDAINATSK